MYGLKQRDIDAILKHLANIEGLEQAWLFGSRAMGNYKEGSDIDIAIKGTSLNRHSILQAIDILNEEEPIPFYIQIIDFSTIENEKLRKHIKTKGKLLINRNTFNLLK